MASPWEGGADIEDVARIAEVADSLGFDYLTCSEHVAVPVDEAGLRGAVYWDPLATLGFLELASTRMYGELGPTWANILLGTLSAIVDNIPIMYAVLQMNPTMDHGQWLLITLTAGVGGSMLSVGSAAGVALMGASKGGYTFFSHLRWTWAIALGYVLSILMHLWWNAEHFSNGVWR